MTASLLPPVTLPQLSGGRERAGKLFDPLHGRMRGRVVRMDCRALVAGTASFADEVIKLVLKDGGASRLVIEHGGVDFNKYLYTAAEDHGVLDKLEFLDVE